LLLLSIAAKAAALVSEDGIPIISPLAGASPVVDELDKDRLKAKAALSTYSLTFFIGLEVLSDLGQSAKLVGLHDPASPGSVPVEHPPLLLLIV
jgi:hypothetical protein